MRTATAVVAGSSFFVACYAYTPIPVTPTTTGDVRLTLTAPSYTESFGPLGAQVRAVEGQLRSVDDSSVTISVTDVARTSDDDERFHGESVTIPRLNIAAFDRRRTDVGRSLALTGLVVAGAIWIAASLGHGSVNQVRQKGSSTGQ